MDASSNNPKDKKLRATGYMLKPLMVTMRIMIRGAIPGHRPRTVMYPWEKNILPDCFRGRPGIILDKCIACSKCVKACPNQCIKMVQIEHETLGKVKRPEVNVGRCMMCGNCAEVCPTNAMIVTPEFELASYTRDDLIYDPIKLQHAWKPGYEINYEELLPSNRQGGAVKKGSMELKDTVILEGKKCISCARCEKTCPTGAVKMTETGEINEKTKKPIKRPVFDDTKCVSCEQCVNICPKDALSMKEAL
jgi:NADH-quinone oxidoreductase subunit I/NAD(P)H-quinone oxidoreductase subunit I